jgi:hypothetical protein
MAKAVIASVARQSSSTPGILDCRATLAMTKEGVDVTHLHPPRQNIIIT